LALTYARACTGVLQGCTPWRHSVRGWLMTTLSALAVHSARRGTACRCANATPCTRARTGSRPCHSGSVREEVASHQLNKDTGSASSATRLCRNARRMTTHTRAAWGPCGALHWLVEPESVQVGAFKVDANTTRSVARGSSRRAAVNAATSQIHGDQNGVERVVSVP